MQHVQRCWERQSDGSEYKKTLQRPGLRPGPRWGSLQRSANPLVGGEGLAVPSPKNPIPRSRPFGPHLFYPHSKISSDAVERDAFVQYGMARRPPKTRPMGYHAEFSWSNDTSLHMEKNGHLASRLSRSLKVIRTNTDRSATYDFLLVTHGKHWPILYRF